MKFTKEQEQAYKFFGNNCLVSAGAGSGKTQVLSERVKYLIQEEGFHIDEFLILTFTELAASEMKHRIRKKLIEINSPEVEKIDVASICTFDSYSLSIVKKYHYLLGLPKNISIINGALISIKEKQILDNILNEYYQKNDETIISFAKEYFFKNDEQLKKIILEVYEKGKDVENAEEYFASLIEKCSLKTCNEFLIYFTNTLDNLFNDYINAGLSSESQKTISELEKLNEQYNSSNGLDERINVLQQNFPRINKLNSNDKKVLKISKDKIKKLVDNFTNEKEFIDNHLKNKKYIILITDIARKILDNINKYKHEHNSFEFMDIAKFAITIFKNHTDIAQSIKNSLKTIMIDEYQDTSKIQEDFISYISNNNVYMVGDVKQSIYRFRKATPELFIDKFNNYQNKIGGELICLPDNFRSRKEMLDDVNTIFSTIMTLPMGGANYKKDHMIISGNKCYDIAKNEQDYSTEVLFYNPIELKGNEYEIEAKIIAEDIINKINSSYMVWDNSFDNPQLRKATLKDFCILCQDGTKFLEFEKVFSEYKIPLYVQNNIDISKNQIVLATISLLSLIKEIRLDNLSSTEAKHAFISICRSYIYKTSDDEIYRYINNGIETSPLYKKLNKFINENSFVSDYDLIYNLFFEFEMYEKLSLIGDIKINEKNLDNFLSSIESLKELNFSLDDYIDYFKNIKELGEKIEVSSSSSDVDAVRLMNIFKSKGLEFPVIYCANLGKSFNRQQYTDNFYLSQKYGIIFPINHYEKTPFFTMNKELELLDDLSEKIRLFYVAITRAKEKVICLLKESDKKGDDVDLNNFSNLGTLLLPVINKLNSRKIDSFNEEKYSFKVHHNIEENLLTYEDIHIEPIIKEKSKRASKKLSFSSNDNLLIVGERLHLILECIDFMNPDYDLIDNNYDKKLVKQFLSSDLIKNLKNPQIYKEYEFIDNNVHAIIDCLIIDQNTAYIIDYKLKNIDDENYHKQLKVYFDYVKKAFSLNAECHLYSIILGKYEKITF